MTTARDRFEQLRTSAPAVLPSLLLCDFGNLEREIEALEDAGVSGLHLDVMDGVFVPNFTYGITIVEAIRKLTELPLDVHLMMVHPEKYLEAFANAGADVLTIHAEATATLSESLQRIQSLGVASGVALNPDTEVEKVVQALPHADLALVMSVHAGFGGQSFMPEVLDKFSVLRQHGGDTLVLEIDGGINPDTIGSATEHGAQLLVAGSAIFKQPDYTQALETMMSKVVA